jgi:predicted Zn-dependent peptidase
MAISFKQATLPNGLTVVAEVDPEAHSSAAGFFVRTGARDEAASLMGVSHFLEHMMFKGTEAITTHDLNRMFDEMGAQNNAYTSAEMTCFYAHVLPERLNEAIDLLGAMMRPALRDADFTTEKNVILEEIAMYKDQPFFVLFEAAQEKHYGKHPLGHRVLGTTESITALTRDQMKLYFDDRYSADNTIVSLAGRLDFEQEVDRIARVCGGWAVTRAGRDTLRPPTHGGAFELRDEKVNRAYLIGLADGPELQDDRRYAAVLLSQVLGAPDNSRLHWALIETGIAEDAQAGYEAGDGTGLSYVFATCDPEKAGEVWETIEKETENLLGSVTEDDLTKLRNKLATGVTLAGERPADRMQRLGRMCVGLLRYRTLEEELELINRVTVRDLKEVAEAFPLRWKTRGTLLPKVK